MPRSVALGPVVREGGPAVLTLKTRNNCQSQMHPSNFAGSMLLKTKKVGKVCSLCGGCVLVGGWGGGEDQVPAERTLRSTKFFF